MLKRNHKEQKKEVCPFCAVAELAVAIAAAYGIWQAVKNVRAHWEELCCLIREKFNRGAHDDENNNADDTAE